MSQICLRKIWMARSLWAAVILNVGVTVVHLLVWIILPFDSQKSVASAWGIFLGFQAIFLAAIFALYYFFSECANPSDAVSSLEKMDLRWLAVLSVVGLLFHLIAKYPILEQVDWQCISRLRWAWISHDKGADPAWRRVLSILAYILSHFAMPMIFISVFQLGRQIRDTKNWFYFILSMFVLVVFAMVIVSRMMLLTGVAVAISGGGDGTAVCWRRYSSDLVPVSCGFSSAGSVDARAERFGSRNPDQVFGKQCRDLYEL